MQISFTTISKFVIGSIVGFALSSKTWAEDLTIRLPAGTSVSRKTVQYLCDAQASKIGIPATPFTVEYINGAGNSLAVVPIGDKPVIFAAVISGSGARYTAQQFTWWDAHGSVALSSEAMSGPKQFACHPVQQN